MAISLSGAEFIDGVDYSEQPARRPGNSVSTLDEKLRRREDEFRRRMREKFGYQRIQCLKYNW